MKSGGGEGVVAEEAGLGVEDGVEDEGRYIRNGMCFSGVAGLRRMVEILRKMEKSSAGRSRSAYSHCSVLNVDQGFILSCTEFHNCVECSFDMLIIPLAFPLRTKSA